MRNDATDEESQRPPDAEVNAPKRCRGMVASHVASLPQAVRFLGMPSGQLWSAITKVGLPSSSSLSSPWQKCEILQPWMEAGRTKRSEGEPKAGSLSSINSIQRAANAVIAI